MISSGQLRAPGASTPHCCFVKGETILVNLSPSPSPSPCFRLYLCSYLSCSVNLTLYWGHSLSIHICFRTYMAASFPDPFFLPPGIPPFLCFCGGLHFFKELPRLAVFSPSFSVLPSPAHRQPLSSFPGPLCGQTSPSSFQCPHSSILQCLILVLWGCSLQWSLLPALAASSSAAPTSQCHGASTSTTQCVPLGSSLLVAIAVASLVSLLPSSSLCHPLCPQQPVSV